MKRTGKSWAVAAAVGVVAVVGWLTWRWSVAGDTGGPMERATALVERRDFSSSVLATGAARPQVGAEVKVGARISGKLARLHANVGDQVARGQVIAELEQEDLRAAFAQREAEVAVAEARLTVAEARMQLAEAEAARQRTLHGNGIASQKAVDIATHDNEVASATIELSRRQIDAARAAQREAEVRLSYATIRAPIAGVIGSVSTQEGETVAAGLSAPTFVTLIDLERLQVDAFVDEVDIGKVKPAQRAIFTVDAFPEIDFEGRVATIYPKAFIEENVVTYDVVLDILTPYVDHLRPDMTASVTIFLETRKDVLAVPSEAILREKGKSLVRVLRGEKMVPQEVRVGWRDSGWIEVVSGLEEGESVLLKEGTAENNRGVIP
jgi:RND family efflux transporter MFP subunit